MAQQERYQLTAPEIADLKRQLKEKDGVIARLSAQLEGMHMSHSISRCLPDALSRLHASGLRMISISLIHHLSFTSSTTYPTNFDAFASQTITRVSTTAFNPDMSSLPLEKIDKHSQNHGSPPQAKSTAAKDTPDSVGQTTPEDLAASYEKPLPKEPSVTNPVLPPRLPVTFDSNKRGTYGTIHADGLISVRYARNLQMAEHEHCVSLEAQIALLTQELTEKDELIARLQAELNNPKMPN
ncbi:hypothetical protein F1880_001127 [Penicillium rolfsii]|nr:hypothetical protein F1880_001127 [Penicillium rolfsii]